MKSEIWLLESHHVYDGTYAELYIHIPDTDLWFTDIGYSEEDIVSVGFTKSFWDKLGINDNLEYLGDL